MRYCRAMVLLIHVLTSSVGQLMAASCQSQSFSLPASSVFSKLLSSPNFPSSYASNDRCYWRFSAPLSSMAVRIEFTSFSLQTSSSCTSDYIEIRDGASSMSTFISRYCGSSFPPFIISKGQHLYMKFVSDSLFQYKGFVLTYKAVYPEISTGKCTSKNSFALNNNIILRSDSGVIRSPNYPFYYPNNMQCTWRIAVTSGDTIRLDFTRMRLESSVTCMKDYVRVRNGYYANSASKGDFCGTSGRTLYSSGRYLWIRFKTNRMTVSTGFELSYKTDNTTSSSNVSLIVGVSFALFLIAGIVVFIVCCMKKNRASGGAVVHNGATSAVTNTTVTTCNSVAMQPPRDAANPDQGGPPAPYGYPNPYPPQGRPLGTAPQGQPMSYPGPPQHGQTNPYLGGQYQQDQSANCYPGPPVPLTITSAPTLNPYPHPVQGTGPTMVST